MKSLFNTTFFQLFKLMLKIEMKKISSIILPIVTAVLSFIVTIVFLSVDLSGSQPYFLFYGWLIFLSIISIIYIGIKAVSVFHDFEKYGLEIIIFSKKISRNQIVLAKIIFVILFSFLWALLIWILNTILYSSNIDFFNKFNFYLLNSFLTILFLCLFFGAIISLIISKFSPKIALTIPLIFFLPLTFLGLLINQNTIATNQKFASNLSVPAKNLDSGTLSNIEGFYLNNNKNELIVFPKNVDNNFFENYQKEYIQKAFNNSYYASLGYQVYDWLAIPYQFIDIFNNKKTNQKITDNSLLDAFIYGLRNGDKDYEYKLSNKSSLINLPIKNSNNSENFYIVPGGLKNSSIFDNLVNRELIYARENADNFDVNFEEDSYTFTSPNNLVGKINYKIIEQAIRSKIFEEKAHIFYENISSEISKSELLKKINEAISQNSVFTKIIDNNTILFNESLDSLKIKNFTEKQAYLAVALVYFLYYNYNSSSILKILLKNDDSNLGYQPSQLKININGNNYFIGGYSSFIPVQKVMNDKLIFRYQLNPSNNYLFQATKEVFSLQANTKIIERNSWYFLWFIIVIFLLFFTYRNYVKKDYR